MMNLISLQSVSEAECCSGRVDISSDKGAHLVLMRAARSTDATRFLKILAACTPEHDVPGDNKNLFFFFFPRCVKPTQ